MSQIIEHLTTSADDHGRWRAKLTFAFGVSESDPRAEFNLHHHWGRLRARARSAIVSEIADREQKTRESRLAAEQRVRAALPRLQVIAQDIDSLNIWHGVTFGEA